jgi:WD40 repeat protein
VVYHVELGRIVKDCRTSTLDIGPITALPKELYTVAWTATVGGEERVCKDPFSSLAGNLNPWLQRAYAQRTDSPFIATGHNGSVRLWNLDSRKLLTTPPMRANAGRETHERQLAFTPTGYHLLYADLTNKLYFIDPRAYLIRFTSVTAYYERDME